MPNHPLHLGEKIVEDGARGRQILGRLQECHVPHDKGFADCEGDE